MGLAILGGLASALFAFSAPLAPHNAFGILFVVLAYFVQLPLFLLSLSHGIFPALLAGGSATLVTALGSGLIGGSYLESGMNFLLWNAGPVIFVSHLALLARPTTNKGHEWYPPGRLLLWLVAWGSFILGVVYLFPEFTGLGAIDFKSLEGMSKDAMSGTTPDTSTAAKVTQIIFVLKNYMSGVMATSWAIMFVINAIVAQVILARTGYNRRPIIRLQEIDLPSWFLLLVAFTGLAAMILGGHPLGLLAQNLLILVSFPFFLLGLGTVHVYCSGRERRRMLLGVFYGFMILFGWLVLFVTILGVFEPWLKLRQNVSKRKKG